MSHNGLIKLFSFHFALFIPSFKSPVVVMCVVHDAGFPKADEEAAVEAAVEAVPKQYERSERKKNKSLCPIRGG